MASSVDAAEAVFAKELERLRGPVFEFLRRITHDYHTAQDLTQETFLRALHARRTQGAPARLSGWVFRVAYRAALDGVRRRSVPATFALDREAEALPDREPDSRSQGLVVIEGMVVERERLLEEVRGAIFALPWKYRDLFIARYEGGLNCRRAAALLGISRENAKIRLHRGRHWIARRVIGRLREGAGVRTEGPTNGAGAAGLSNAIGALALGAGP